VVIKYCHRTNYKSNNIIRHHQNFFMIDYILS